jgi:predicted ATPase
VESIARLTVDGLRGVSGELPLHLAIPNGSPGSGLTILVGANNSGKSTVVEAFDALSRNRGNPPTFSIGKRNVHQPNHLRISCTFHGDDEKQNFLELVYGGAESRWVKREVDDVDISVVPSRRGFEPFFSRSMAVDRRWFYSQRPTAQYRPQSIQSFEGRLFKINSSEDRPKFDAMLSRVMGRPTQWTIDEMDGGQNFLKFYESTPQFYHSSDGVGDGIISLFVIVSALYDSEPGSVIVIDEPELSLHPQFQRRLATLISELSSDRQIVCATHSPYFINWPDVENGAEITRCYKNADYNVRLARASRPALAAMVSLGKDTHNPHLLGLNATEVFFLDDQVIVTEGQEDVVYFEKISKELDKHMVGDFYGWGAGGAKKIGTVCHLLRDLHYSKVVGIFDADQPEEKAKCDAEFEKYRFVLLPADDIRDKPSQQEKPAKAGLWKSGLSDETTRAATVEIYDKINEYMNQSSEV